MSVKPKVRPKYIPSPTNGNIERSAIFRVTGGCYFGQFSIFDADPNGVVYTDYTSKHVRLPTFHTTKRLFEYADAVQIMSASMMPSKPSLQTERTDVL